MRAKPRKTGQTTKQRLLHPRNRHQGSYDFPTLIQACPELSACVNRNAYGNDSINFADPKAVKLLNRALLKRQYGINDWNIPPGFLCPPIPGRADYLHYLADLLAVDHQRNIPRGESVKVLDIGVGANCVYPLIGHAEYGWHFVGSDIDPAALNNAHTILAANPDLMPFIELRQQQRPTAIFTGIIGADERFDLTLCNPPFHASASEASAGSQRKWQNLGKPVQQTGKKSPILNFGGRADELWCPGGEGAFVSRMIKESVQFSSQCLWFTSLVAKSVNLPEIYRTLKQVGVAQHKTIKMAQGQKQSRFVAWSFLSAQQHEAWWAQRSDEPSQK